MEKNTLDKEPEKEKNKEEIKEETKKEILDLAINDWINEFTKILNTLEIAGFKKNTSALFSAKGEKYAIKNFWERYSDFTKDMFLELENECAELKGMREAVEESEKNMDNPNKGKITQVLGNVVDIEFESRLPGIFSALTIKRENGEEKLVLEVNQHLGGNKVRCIAMDSTDGLSRGMEA